MTIYNVGLWLVAKFAIVAFFPNYSETHVLFGGFTFVAKKWESFFFLEKKTAYKHYRYYRYYKYFKYYKYCKYYRYYKYFKYYRYYKYYKYYKYYRYYKCYKYYKYYKYHKFIRKKTVLIRFQL